MSVSPIACRHDAVKEVYAPCNTLNNVSGCPDTHQITGLVLRHVFFHRFDGVIHFLVCLPYGKAADGITGQIKLCDPLHVLNAQVVKYGALVDTEKHLPGIDGALFPVIFRQRCFAAFQPARCPLAGALNILFGRRDLNALIKCHCDIRAEI